MSGICTYSRLGFMGRLGNQMFQIAATIAYGLEHNKEARFPKWDYSKYFNHKLNLLDQSVNSDHSIFCYQEPHFHYSEIPKIEGDVGLVGFFQSEKYFKKHESEIRDIFSLSGEWESEVYSKFETQVRGYERLKEKCFDSIVGVHIRRGDYVTNVHTNAYHGVLPSAYYEAGANEIFGEIYPQDVLFFVFSDDPQWCKDNLKFPHMIFSEDEEDIVDMYKMSFCDDFIIANSSFSWWAAYLGKGEDKMVVAPRNWFAGANLFCEDIYCKDWMLV